MPASPDPRWQYILGGFDDEGLPLPMSFDILNDLALEWAAMIPDRAPDDGAVAILRTSRSLFAHAWYDYEFMAVACLVGFQALEAAFRQLYPDATDRTPLRRLVKRAESEGVLTPNIADLAHTGVELRNLLSHPASAAGFSVGMAGGMLDNTHRLVGLVVDASVDLTESK